MFGTEQVRATGGAEQHRPSGEGARTALVGIQQHVAHMRVGVARRLHDLQPRPGLT